MTSASSGVSVRTSPSDAPSTSAILSESYSFIWQPKVLMNTFFCMVLFICRVLTLDKWKSSLPQIGKPPGKGRVQPAFGTVKE